MSALVEFDQPHARDTLVPARVHNRVLGARGRDVAVDGSVRTLELQLDQYGSPVPLEAEAWYVCLVPGLVRQWWHPVVNQRHKHLFIMRPTRFSGARSETCYMSANRSPAAAPRWMTCAALVSYLLGRPYWVWTPHDLYKRLLREPNICRVDGSRLVSLNAAELAEASQAIYGLRRMRAGRDQAAARGTEALLHELRP